MKCAPEIAQKAQAVQIAQVALSDTERDYCRNAPDASQTVYLIQIVKVVQIVQGVRGSPKQLGSEGGDNE